MRRWKERAESQDVYGCKPDQPSLQANGSGGEQYNIPSGGPNSYNICA